MQVAEAVDQFVQAALTPDLWPEALDAIARALGAEGATLVLGRTSTASVAVSRSIAPIVEEYFRARSVPDPREQRVQPALAGGFVTDFDDFAPGEIAHDPYYQEFLRPHGFGFHAVSMLAFVGDPLVLSLKRPYRRGHYDGAELDGLGAALPHLRAAARVATLAWRARFDGELETFARVGIGGALIDRHGRVVATNGAWPAGDGLDILGGEIVAGLGSDRAALNRLIGQALRGSGSAEGAPGDCVPVRRPSGRRPYVVDMLSLAQAHRSLLTPAVAIVLVRDPAMHSLPGEAALRTLFHLTPREAALALRLAAGTGVREAAQAIGISEGHARQRLKSIFAKTETSRQAELVALLLRIR